MTRIRPVRPFLRGLPAVLAGLLVSVPPSPGQEPGDEAGAQPGSLSAPILDSARTELRAGRILHASRLLRRHLDGAVDTGRVARGLLAETEARAGRWKGVRAALEPAVEAGDASVRELIRYGRSLLATGDRGAAGPAFETAAEAAPGAAESVAARVGLARARFGAGEAAAGVALLEEVGRGYPGLADWLRLEAVREAVDAGAPAVAAAALDGIRRREVRDRAHLPAMEAHLAAGDTAAALDIGEEGVRSAASRSVRARLLIEVGDLRRAGGDEAGALREHRRALETEPGVEGGVEAARRLASAPGLDVDGLALAARTLADADRSSEALEVLARALEGDAGERRPELELLRGRLLYRAGRWRRAEEALARVAASAEGTLAAEARLLRGRAAFRAGRSEVGRRRMLALAGEHPGTGEAALGLFLLADMAHDRGDLEEARSLYRETVETSPGDDRAGLARMRLAQMALGRGDLRESVERFEAYLEAYPRGRRWQEAMYWAGRIRLERDPEDGRGRELLRGVLRRAPLSYYGHRAAERLGVEPRLPAPPGESASRGSVARTPIPELEAVDLLNAAELSGAAAAEVERLLRWEGRGDEATLELAEAFAARGYAREGIRLGYRLLARGRPLTGRLLGVLYPLPHRELFLREASEWRVELELLAGIARRESVFDPEAVSRAGAVGLMQVMPATGRMLARREGIEPFGRELLTRPDVSVHLASAHLDDLRRRWPRSLPLLLAAYNAGASPARRWRDFPEASDTERFVERIPYRETRRYVKAVLANAETYRRLYGAASEE